MKNIKIINDKLVKANKLDEVSTYIEYIDVNNKLFKLAQRINRLESKDDKTSLQEEELKLKKKELTQFKKDNKEVLARKEQFEKLPKNDRMLLHILADDTADLPFSTSTLFNQVCSNQKSSLLAKDRAKNSDIKNTLKAMLYTVNSCFTDDSTLFNSGVKVGLVNKIDGYSSDIVGIFKAIIVKGFKNKTLELVSINEGTFRREVSKYFHKCLVVCEVKDVPTKDDVLEEVKPNDNKLLKSVVFDKSADSKKSATTKKTTTKKATKSADTKKATK